jgi:hypothetical protein
MALSSGSIPNLLNGVSQQPEVLRHPTQGAKQINMLSSTVKGLSHRPPAQFHSKPDVITPGTGSFTHFIDRDTTERYILVIKSDGSVNVWDMNTLTWKTVATPDGTAYLTAGSEDPKDKLRAMTVGDYTFIVNRKKTVAKDTVLSPDRIYGALCYVKQGAYSSVYRMLNSTGGVVGSYTTDAVDPTTIRTNKIAFELATAVEASASYDSVYISGSNAFLVDKTDGTDFNNTVDDSIGGNGLGYIHKTVQNFGNLPSKALVGMILEVTGDPGTKFDNFYVKATGTASSGSYGDVTWTECVAPAIEYKLDASTMPHILVRESDGTFTFKKATWSNRGAGNTTTNPWPSFVGRKIEDVFFYSNRLGFLAGESATLSEIGKPFSFFRKTVTTSLDTDPIDVTVTTNKVAKLYHAVPHGGDLLLFSDRVQFKMAGDPLTPASAALQVVTEYDCNINMKPISSGLAIFFAFQRGNDTGIREFAEDKSGSGYVGNDITDYVSGYVHSNARRISHAKSEDIFFVLTDNDPKKLFVHSYKWADRIEGREKVQSSWSVWEFPYDIELVAPLEHKMLVVFNRGSTSRYYIAEINLKPDAAPYAQDWMPHLDLWIRRNHSQMAQSYSGGNTTFTLPFAWSGTGKSVTVMRLYDGDETNKPAGQILTPTSQDGSTQTVTFNGVDLTADNLVFGLGYNAEYEFTMPTVREKSAEGGASIPITEGELTLNFWAINYTETAGFHVEVTTENGVTRTYSFEGPMVTDPKRINQLRTGTLKFPVRGRARGDLTIKLIVDHPYPANFVNAGWEGNFVIRSNRF